MSWTKIPEPPREAAWLYALLCVAPYAAIAAAFSPLADCGHVCMLGPILVNILLFHLLFHVPGVITGAVCTMLEVFLIWSYRANFRGLFTAV